MNRRHDIDALRALAFALVIIYHVGMYYVAGWHWHLKSPHDAQWLQWPMRALNLWRMDLVFLISGLALGFMRGGRSAVLRERGRMLRERSKRLLLPLAFGMAVVVPFQPYAQGVANGLVAPGLGDFLLRYYAFSAWPAGAFDGWEARITWNHLWYLAYLWLYTAVLVLALPLLDSKWGQGLRQAFVGLRGARLVLLPMLPLAVYALTLAPGFPPTRDLIHDWWLHAAYFTLFLYGWWMGVDAGLWNEMKRLRYRTLAASLALMVAVLALVATVPSGPARAFVRVVAQAYLWITVVAVLGWAHASLNRPWPWLAWANESVYPWYVLHQTVIIVLVVWLAPLALGPVVEPVLLVAGTVCGCWATTTLVQRARWLRPLFGLKPVPPRYPSPARQVHPPVHSA
ncbi:acyltransferase [Caenimonas koreensis]|uniref:acyltransferase family protein n=1 Tax=Caenimonas koreensis TaxID=367474 RepID=UPI0037836029